MANDKDKFFEKIYFLWKGEGEKRNQSIDWFCERYGANVGECYKWFKGINKAVKEIQVVGRSGEPVQAKLSAMTTDLTIFKSSIMNAFLIIINIVLCSIIIGITFIFFRSKRPQVKVYASDFLVSVLSVLVTLLIGWNIYQAVGFEQKN